MSDPVCRTCYAKTLSPDAFERFIAEPVTMPEYYCPEHQQRMDEILRLFDKVVLQR